ncbi:hypothetical protein K503DRAFT_869428 [Rhizopogon vinicolor AM-OR11-026]|uniref:Methyltransferase domain-containing protein n=1 Tax=Rhizopogon vinicolor AM-OR11-026 TaxID=1314800 RepID=A0A1B7MM37_9AGAM|nr:hypothetical protein K503DRAFT_869428 [Rhizopogon vinicolor AM-OR11-026]
MEDTAAHKDSNLLLGNVTSRIPAVDPRLFNLTPEEAAFFKTQIGIDDDIELKKHILEVQSKAYKIAPYPCIRGLAFLRLNLSSHPVYERILKLGRERPDAVLLDIGCCFGVDSRKVAVDGFPVENIISSDISNELLNVGHELFRTTPSSYGGHLLPGDVFDPAFLLITEPSEDVSSAPVIDLSSLKHLNLLHGRISAINATRLFHCFTEDKQLHLARALAGLLSAQPGSVICGSQVGAREMGNVTSCFLGTEYKLFAHSPKTWSSLWDGKVFQKGSVGVKVETELVELTDYEEPILKMMWSVTRL